MAKKSKTAKKKPNAKFRKLLFVTTNAHKVEEIGSVLENYGVKLRQVPVEVQEPGYETIDEVAVHKAKDAFRILKKPLIVEDTGIFLNAFKNFPGVYSKRIWKAIGFEGFFRLLKGKTRKATFEVAIVYIVSPTKYWLFKGKLAGTIGHRVVGKGANKLPYEKIFYPKFSKKAMIKISREEKNAMSHRAIAANKLGKWLLKHKFTALEAK